MPERRLPVFLLALATAFIPARAHAQAQTPAAAATPASGVHRWIDWQAAALESRYRIVENSAEKVTTNQVQMRESVRLGFLFDRARRYSIQMGAGTGSSFTGSWDALGPGTGEATWDPNVRSLFVSAAPVRGIAVDVGGFGLNRGEATEITTWDNDGYLTGERVTLRRPHQRFVDELAVTAGFLGDLSTPNVFRRLDRLDDHNYTQVLALKRTREVSVSGDWTSYQGITTLREAARVATRAWMPLDALRLEVYQRVEGTHGYGFAVAAERALPGAVTVGGGYATVDQHFGTLNGDRYGIGRRLFTETRVTLLSTLTLSAYYGVAVNTPFAIPNKQRFDLVASWNVLKAVQRAGLW